MNTYQKGKMVEREFCQFLEAEGFATWKPAWNRFGSKDILNAFDIIAVKKTMIDKTGWDWGRHDFRNFVGSIILVQVKSSKAHKSDANRQIDDFLKSVGWCRLTFPIDLLIALKEKDGWIIINNDKEAFFEKVKQ